MAAKMNNTPQAALDKPLPNDSDLERLVLGVLLMNNPVWSQARRLLDVDFYLPTHRRIFAIIRHYCESHQPIDPIILIEQLKIDGDLAISGGHSYVMSLIDGVPKFSQIGKYVKTLKRLSALRQFAHIGSELVTSAFDYSEEPADLIANAQDRLKALASPNGRRSKWAGEVLETALARQQLFGLPSGLPELDKLLRGGGLVPGDFFVIAARTGKGKSTLAVQIAASVADRFDLYQWQEVKKRKPVVLYIALESDNEDVIERALTINAELSYESLQTNQYTAEEKKRRNHWIGRIDEWRLACCDVPRMSAADVFDEVQAIQDEEGQLDLVVVDYLGLLTGDAQTRDRHAQLEKLTRELKIGAAEHKVPLIVPVQINREGEAHERYELRHLRGCGTIEQDATKILIIQETEDDTASNGCMMDATLDKQRRGVTGHLKLFKDKRFGSFSCIPNSGTTAGVLPKTSVKAVGGSKKKQTLLGAVEDELKQAGLLEPT